MSQVQQRMHSASSSTATRYDRLSSRLLACILVGVASALLLTCIELALVWVFNPWYILGRNSIHRLSALSAIPALFPLLLLIPLVELVGISLAAFLAAKPVAILAYLRDTQKAQERQRKMSISLHPVAIIYDTPVTYYKHTPDPTIADAGERVSMLDLVVQQQDTSLLLLGASGTGKSLVLQRCQSICSQPRLALARRQKKIPIYIPLKNYSLFLKTHLAENAITAGEEESSDEQASMSVTAVTRKQQGTLIDFLRTTDLPGIGHLRPYIKKLFEQGRVLLFCDGLNEVDPHYREAIAGELGELLLVSQNRLVITCRDIDYREQQELIALVNEGHLERAVIDSLQLEQVREFIEQYMRDQDDQGRYTAGQMMQMIEHSRLRYLCTNPLVLFTLMESIDKIGIERGKQLDTRGYLLQEYVAQVIERTGEQSKWKRGAPTASDVLQLLSRIAFVARSLDDPYAIQLPMAGESMRQGAHGETPASGLLTWLEKDPAPFSPERPSEAYDLATVTQVLQFAHSAGLIDLSPSGVLSFPCAMIANYFVAQYFSTYNNNINAQASFSARSPVLSKILLANAVYWSEPVALWAGLMDSPMQLAEQFAELGDVEDQSRRETVPLIGSFPVPLLQSLALSLICTGVSWVPPYAEFQQEVVISDDLASKLARVIRDGAARKELARLFTDCAGEGTQEIYRSLIPLLMIEGIDEFIVLLDPAIVLELLFSYLCDSVDIAAYEAQVKRLCRILWSFGRSAVDYAGELSRPLHGRSVRLRAAAINILGGTQDQSAVEPLIACLGDAERFVVERSINALFRLGPDISLERLRQELENLTPLPVTRQVHWAALITLSRFFEGRGAKKKFTTQQYQRILEPIVLVLASNYAKEPETQQQAHELLVRFGEGQASWAPVDATWLEAQATEELPEATQATGHLGAALVVNLLIKYLSFGDEMMVGNVARILQEIGSAATPLLLEQVQQTPSEIVRTRIIEILKKVRDARALPDIIRLVADPSPLVQQQVTSALHIFSPASIAGLIDLVLADPSETVAVRAVQILGGMGEEVVEPVSRALSPVTPGRTRLLVQVLDEVHDARAIPALIMLLQEAQSDPLLAIAVIRALSHFSTRQVVRPLLDVLPNSQPQIYEEAIDALSSLGVIALDDLLAALDVREETITTPRVRRALLGMFPFPGEALLNALRRASDAQARQIMSVLRGQGADAAHVLVQHLFDKDARVRGYVHHTLNEMQGAVVVPPLLEVLNRPSWREVIAGFLLSYNEAIAPLVNLLGDSERADAAVAILPRFGPAALAPLISALSDPRMFVQGYAQDIIIALVRKNPDALSHVVRLFSLSLPLRAHEALLEVLTNDLVDVSIPALLDGLEDAYLVDDVSEALARLARKRDWQRGVLDGLLRSLRNEKRRRGAAVALVKVGAPAVHSVGELLTDRNQAVAQASQDILREIGAPALSFIWAAHGDTSNPARREAAMKVFHSMPVDAIKDALVELLASDQPEDISMAQALLLERIHDEAALPQANHEMIPALLEYVQIHDSESASQRIIALLLLLGGEAVVQNLVQVLYDNSDHPEQLAYALLFLGQEARVALADILGSPHAPARLRAEAMGILGLSGPHKEVYEYAQSLGNYGLAANRTSVSNPEKLAISLRALGSLLASGDWDIPTLQNLRRISQENSTQSELYSVLLGWRFEPEIARLKADLQNERDARKNEIMNLTARIVQDQSLIRELETELDQVRHEHGLRGDELLQVSQEREAVRKNLDQSMKEREAMRGTLEQTRKEKEVFRTNLDQALQEKQALQAEIARLEAYNKTLQQQIKLLRGTE